MDSRERVFRALERTGPDRLPIFQHLLPGAMLRALAGYTYQRA